MKKNNNLIEGNIQKILIALAIPIMGSSFLQMTYGLIDMIWIGRLGSSAVAGIGTASFFINLGFAISSMVVAGSGIKISHAVGAGEDNKTEEFISNGFILNAIFSLPYIAVLLFFRKNLIGFFKLNDPAVESMAETYMIITGLALAFKVTNFLYVKILNSFGETKLPFKINCVGVVFNIVLDPLLIFWLNMGVAGAALATFISQALITILFMRHSKSFFVLRTHFKFQLEAAKEILALGLPRGIQRVLFTGFGIIIAKITAGWGPDAIAAQKIGLQMESVSYMTVGGIYGAASSFIGQNYGAKLKDRLEEGYKTAFKLAFLVGTITSVLFIVLPDSLIRIFISDPSTIKVGVGYLRIIGFSQLFMCVEVITNGSFSGIGNPKIPTTISIIFTGMRIPLALFLSQEHLFGLNGVWISISLTSILKGIISPVIFKRELKKLSFQ
jgi:MATE family, multidrug efflux pump